MIERDRFMVTRAGAVVGFSSWPWDDIYIPVVGCFVGGSLHATADCDRTLADLQPPPIALRRRSRLKRRVFRMLGLPVPPLPEVDTITLAGPDRACWFRLDLPPEIVERLRRGDPAVRIERLEDSATLARADEGAAEALAGPMPVEALLNEPDGVSGDRLDGFSAFLAAPPQHQFEMAFVEYLRRMPEAGARHAHLYALQRGDVTLFQVRRAILDSEEFRGRRVGYGARLGASLVSPLWRDFATLPAPLAQVPSSVGPHALVEGESL